MSVRRLAAIAAFTVAAAFLGASLNDSPPLIAADPGAMDAMSVDMDITGNTATSLGPWDECIVASPGSTVPIDVTATNIPAAYPMFAFTFSLNFPAGVATVQAANPDFLLGSTEGSSLFDASDPRPDGDGVWTGSVVDISDYSIVPPESGSGVLHRVILRVAAGAAAGVYPLGLTASAHVDITNTYHSPATTNNAFIAVNSTCDNLPTSSPTPEPTPTPVPTLPPPPGPPSGDIDCSGAVNSVDGLKILQFDVGLPVAQNEPCPDIGATSQGDVDCDGYINPRDALAIFRYVAGLPALSATPGCPPIEAEPASGQPYPIPDGGTPTPGPNGYTVSITSAAVGAGGETTVFLHLSAPQPGASAYSISVDYDPFFATATACSVIAQQTACNPAFGGPAGTVRIAGAVPAGLVGEVDLASITFRAGNVVGVSDLVPEISMMLDPAGDPRSATAVPGNLTVQVGAPTPTPTAPTPSPSPTGGLALGIESAATESGGTATVALTALAPSPGIGALTVDVAYDEARLDFAGCSSHPFGLCAKTADGNVRFVGASSLGISGSIVIGTVTFHAGAEEGIVPLHLTIDTLTDPEGTDLIVIPLDGAITIATPTSTPPGGVTPAPSPTATPTPTPIASPAIGIESATVAPGGTVTVELTAEATSPGIGAFTIDIAYDQTRLGFVACAAHASGLCFDTPSGDLRIAGASAVGISGSIVLGTLTFQAGAQEGIVVLDVTIVTLTAPDGADLGITPVDGIITIAASTPTPTVTPGPSPTPAGGAPTPTPTATPTPAPAPTATSAPTPAPPIDVEIKIDETGTVGRGGDATIHGSVRCSVASFVDLTVEVRQWTGKARAEGVTQVSIWCDGRSNWKANVEPEGREFKPGRVTVSVLVSAHIGQQTGGDEGSERVLLKAKHHKERDCDSGREASAAGRHCRDATD